METQTKLSISAFSCRSIKSSVHEIKSLCDSVDILLLQEHWLLPNELNFFNSIHSDFLATAYSAVDLSQGILVGRPYGGTAVLYRKSTAFGIKPVETYDSRICAINIDSNMGHVLLMGVYMPTDGGDAECVENYAETCANLTALIAESDAVHFVIAGDFNCHTGSRFFRIFKKTC
jgi:hypothetical protein